MERLGWVSPLLSPSAAATTASLGYVRWEEVTVSTDKGRREVHYYLKRMDGRSDLAVVGKEKSLRHMSYHYALKIRSLLLSAELPLKLKSRREVVDWLNSIVSDSPPYESLHLAGSLDKMDDYRGDFKDVQKQKVGHYATEFLWLGASWTCRKRRKHYQSFCRNGVKISVHDFVYVLAEKGKRLVAHLEDMYEDSKGNKMAVVRWFHKTDEVGIDLPHNYNDREIFFSLCLQDLNIECLDGLATVLSPQHLQKFLSNSIQSKTDPFLCCKKFEIDEVKPFDITQVKGYWKQEILHCMSTTSPSKDRSKSKPVFDLKGGDESEGFCTRPRKRLRRSKDADTHTSNKLMSFTGSETPKSLVDCKIGSVKFTLKERESAAAAVLPTAEAKQNSPWYLKVGFEVEVLSLDSGIRGCWFRALIIKKKDGKVKVRYQDIKDAADESSKLEEWILASRIAAPDQLGIRVCGRSIVRPALQPNEGHGSLAAVDVGSAVDAWWHDAWWEGIVLKKESEDRIQIYFPGEKQESFFSCADLRISQEWVGNEWVHIKQRPETLASIPAYKEPKQVMATSGENKLAQTAISDAKQSGKTESGCSALLLDSENNQRKELEAVPDLSKDDLLAQLSWKSLKKRRRGGSPSQKSRHSPSEVLRPSRYDRFLIPKAMKVDHDNCKYITDSLFTSSVVQPLTSLVMSR